MVKVFKSKDEFKTTTKKRKKWSSPPMRLSSIVYELRMFEKNRNGAGRSYVRIMDKDGVIRGAIIDVGVLLDWSGSKHEQVYRPFIQVDGECDIPTSVEKVLKGVRRAKG